MLNALKTLLREGRYTVTESFDLPERLERNEPIPRFLFDSRIGLALHKDYRNGLWRHQARALEKLGQGQNVVVSTGTASGKSLIFRTIALHKMLLSKTDTVVVFYPLKALAADQLRGWRKLLRSLDIPESLVGRIDGSVHSSERERILISSRVVIMTPDIVQAWLMARLASPVTKEFVKNISLIIMDEAHTLEGVFGSNFAFLLRRLLSARQFLGREARGESIAPQLFASTATITNPAEHLHLLTGQEFELVDHEDDGSPRYAMSVAHIGAPMQDELSIARTLQTELLTNSSAGGFITFLDSRKGVESLAISSQAELQNLYGDGAVMPYRAGYDAEDRQSIEERLQTGQLRGVVSTSALELGIDLPHISVGINVGIPSSRKAYRQRLGRVGRSFEGAFLVIAEPSEFRRFGTSLREFHDLSVEPSYLYLDNRFMQFAHARCLMDELEALGAPASSLPTHMKWPKNFEVIFNSAKPGGNRPPEFDAIAQIGGDSPQRNYPLRNIGEMNFKIALNENAESLGDATETQALRECYPGAVYLHFGRAYDVVSWHTNSFVPFIKVRPTSPKRRTKPRVRTWINAGIYPEDLCESHLLEGQSGLMAECQMQITEKVEGFVEESSGKYTSYQELRQRNPNMRPRIRNFRTTGVLLTIYEDWFKEEKDFISTRLSEIFCREYSVAQRDIGFSATNISVRNLQESGHKGNSIVIFDQTYGSLRLTERLYLDFPKLLDRMAVSLATEEEGRREIISGVIENLRSAFESFSIRSAETRIDIEGVDLGYIQVYAPQSTVCFRERGKLATEVTIIRPTIMEGGLMYQVECPPRNPNYKPAKRWVAASAVEPSAEGEWDYLWWNAETEEFEEPDETNGEGPPSAAA